jgi:nuclear protein localization family protein 4
VFAFYDDIQLNGSANTAHVNGATLSGDVPMSEISEPLSSPTAPTTTQKGPRGPVKQDAVDDVLDDQDGKIPRKRDPKMCKHGEKGMCDYCMPLEVRLPKTQFPKQRLTCVPAIRPKIPRRP